MEYANLPKDLNNICKSFLSQDEQIYSQNDWNKFNKNNVCEIAAENGWLDLLIYGINNGCQLNSNVCYNAAMNNHLEILKWMKTNNYEIKGGTSFYAAKYNHHEIIKWMKENDYEIENEVCYSATINGNLDILKLAIKRCTNVYDINPENMFEIAVAYGHLNILKFLIEDEYVNTSCIDSTISIYAIEKGYLEILKYFYSIGIEINENICKIAQDNHQLEVLEWGKSKNYKI